MRHDLDLLEPYFTDMLEGGKTFEVRQERPDRRFAVGDILVFHHHDDPARTFLRRVRYVLRTAGAYGLDADWCVMSLDPVDRAEAYREMVRLNRLTELDRDLTR